MSLGGLNGVRAYADGDVYVDEGYTATLELRVALPRLIDALPGQLQLTAFVDRAGGNTNSNPWGGGANSRTLTEVAPGLKWFDSGRS